MNIYADRGNMILLERRCAARGIGFELTAAEMGEPVDAAAHDLFYMGGGQDRDQVMIAEDMVETKREALTEAVAVGKTMLAVCGGYQLLGHSYELGEETIPGLGIVDLKTVRSPGPRLIGNVVIELDVDGSRRRLAGFENHGGRTFLGEGELSLGEVIYGHGNNGSDGREGVRRNNLFGTYLHGPLLPKNSWFADHLVSLALARDGESMKLDPLPDELERSAHENAIRAAARDRRRRRFALPHRRKVRA
jgi:hypothetical protein